MRRLFLFLGSFLFASSLLQAYPLDGYPSTGIRRLEGMRLIESGEIEGVPQPPGARLTVEQVQLRLQNFPDLAIPEPDPELQAGLMQILGAEAASYGICVLDISDPEHPRYAEHRPDITQNPGSVGKILVALSIFQTLADLYPEDVDARRRLLQTSTIEADSFMGSDHHTVRLWNPGDTKILRRRMQVGDKASWYEFLDWMLSPSSNAAAAMNQKNLLLLGHFGLNYPPPPEDAAAFWKQVRGKELGDLFEKVQMEPVSRNGLNLEQLRQGSIFSGPGQKLVPGTTSVATARQLLEFALKMEKGQLVDSFSSQELKRLLYITERRIRYASSPALADAAVYFKSGSLFKCKPEEGFTCKAYAGNVYNYMNSLAIVESPAGEPRVHYIVTLLSNVLRQNSASVHQTLATRIHRLIESLHPLPAPVSQPVPGLAPGR